MPWDRPLLIRLRAPSVCALGALRHHPQAEDAWLFLFPFAQGTYFFPGSSLVLVPAVSFGVWQPCVDPLSLPLGSKKKSFRPFKDHARRFFVFALQTFFCGWEALAKPVFAQFESIYGRWGMGRGRRPLDAHHRLASAQESWGPMAPYRRQGAWLAPGQKFCPPHLNGFKVRWWKIDAQQFVSRGS